MTGVKDIRAGFLDYFRSAGHEIVPSSPLVPHNDPSLMFTNAGMVQFKNVFTGLERRDYVTAASSQKCVRAGGKHNDLDNVGYTARHHTFFEMLGNFSFGDYFKEEAIFHAWTVITKEFGLPADKLLVTVYHEDEQAYDLWQKVAGLPEKKIIKISTSDNFWSMGETGPCGPCSEIFYDHGEEISGGPPGSANEDGDRFVEIWNLVFMQYEQVNASERVALPKPSIDTGMGLERIAAVLQGTHNNYEIDLFKALIDVSAALTKTAQKGDALVSHRVIADHVRAVSFLIADGVLPSNDGRGYVLRRIMRRAMRHAHLLGAKDPLLNQLVPELVSQMGQAFPELKRAAPLIVETLKSEEERFQTTLARGIVLLEDEVRTLTSGETLPGDVAFKLYDTFGFPLDLTEDALKPRGIKIDKAGFESAMERQRADARKAWSGSGETATQAVWFDLYDDFGGTEFLGYGSENAAAMVKGIVAEDARVEKITARTDAAIVLNQTVFYGESGGQVGDKGEITSGTARFIVTDVQKKADGLFVHFGRLESGELACGDAVDLQVQSDHRAPVRANHSATHLLHQALRQILGQHVAQKGSRVEPGRLRFDFSHPKPISPDQLDAVEHLANQVMMQNSKVTTQILSVDDAINSGALALFGEKYGDEVRVVGMGLTDAADQHPRAAWSVELCGGTHVARTGEIGVIKIISESAVAAGVRRIEAVTGEGAREYFAVQDRRVKELAELLKVSPANLLTRVLGLLDERKKVERQISELRREVAKGDHGGSSAKIQELGQVRFLARTVSDVVAKDLRSLVDDGKKEVVSGIVAIVGLSENGKAGIVVGVTKDLVQGFSAVDLVKVGASVLGGKGGGGVPIWPKLEVPMELRQSQRWMPLPLLSKSTPLPSTLKRKS